MGFVFVQRQRFAVRDITKRATTRAQIAHDHESGGPFLEAFPQVRTGGFFTNGVQPVLPQDCPDPVDFFAAGDFDANPIGFA